MYGNALSACANAYPSRWVKETLPPRVRLSWLLMTIRLSIISLAGMARTLVAVGRSNDMAMFFTTAAGAPRRTWTSSPSPGAGPTERAGAGVAGALVTPLLTVAVVVGGSDGAGGGAGAACAAGAAARWAAAGGEPFAVRSGL